MKAYTLETETLLFVKNLEEVKKKADLLVEYEDYLWLTEEYNMPVAKFNPEMVARIEKFCERKVVSIDFITKDIPPTDERKVRTYEREKKKILNNSYEATLRDHFEDIKYNLNNFRDASEFPNDHKPF